MGTVMRPNQLSRLLEGVSRRFSVERNPANPYPEGGVTFKFGDKQVYCGAVEWGEMDEVTRHENDPVNPYKSPGSYQRRSWPHVLRNVCGNDEIPREVRRSVFRRAKKHGFARFLDPRNPKHRDLWKEMVGL